MSQMMQMQTMILDMQKQLQVSGGAPAPSPSPAPAPSNRQRRNRFQCWTGGYCFHYGVGCKDKAKGHKDEAALDNRMGDSNKGGSNI